jgi:DNA-binding Lrp family transcriptional regulator
MMPTVSRAQPPSVITALGFSARVERDYHRVLAQSGRELVSVADSLGRSAEQLLRDVRGLVDAGIVRVEDARIHVATPPEAVALLLRRTAASAAVATVRLEEVARAVPHLAAPAARPRPGEVLDVQPIDGEISSGGKPVPLLRALITESAGDLCWLRPDDLGPRREQAMAGIVGQAIEQGRASRAIHPVRAWTDSRETLELRASIGEQVRLLPELPSRMLIIGTSHVVLPEPLGFIDEPRSLVRQPGLVQALTHWFELLWEHATPPPEAGRPRAARAERDRFLLQQLAQGTKDEQIARTLGLSLRTVRRRVADLMTELGADSRFQAGVEAARRGWV